MDATDFIAGICTAAWRLDLHGFAEVTGFDSRTDYTKEKFQRFQALAKNLGEFDRDTLTKLANAPPVTPKIGA